MLTAYQRSFIIHVFCVFNCSSLNFHHTGIDSDDSLLQKGLNYQNHVLHKLLPEQSTHDYYLRPRSYDRSLSVKTDNYNF